MELQSLVSKSKMLVVDELFCIVQMKMSYTCTYWGGYCTHWDGYMGCGCALTVW
jgi:hypothetical protein